MTSTSMTSLLNSFHVLVRCVLNECSSVIFFEMFGTNTIIRRSNWNNQTLKQIVKDNTQHHDVELLPLEEGFIISQGMISGSFLPSSKGTQGV